MSTGVHDTGTGRDWHAEPAHQHLVQFYESDEFLLDMLAQFVTRTLTNQEACIIVARSPHVDELKRRLTGAGVDVSAATNRGQFAALDITSTMSRFMVDGAPSPDRFESAFAPIIDQAARNWGAVRVFGEMVALIAEGKDHSATIKLEQIWNDMLERHSFTLYCAYPMSAFSQPGTETLLDDICAQHSAVFPAESFTLQASPEERFHAIARLQQKAARLSVEVENRKQIEERLRVALNAERAARQEAESALRLRDEFVSVAAHELNTPLTSLIGRAQFLLRSQQKGASLDSRQMTAVMESVASQADKLSRLTNQLLDVSRVKGGKLAIERHPVDIVELVGESIESIHQESNAPQIVITAPESLTADVDPLRLEQVIVNLLNNATKYSPSGGAIEVTIDRGDSRMFEITVRDYGPGIPPENRDYIFDRFYQANPHNARSGLGLGLYISREIVELHEGDLHAEFPEDGGTRFVVRLPSYSSPEYRHPD